MDDQPILSLAAFDSSRGHELGAALEARVRERTRLFGAASVLFYDRPLELVRGAGCRVYDADGREYLDAYNNVPSVGHCHPHVVAAVARQAAELNVHNRYLHPTTTAYAGRLLRTLPDALGNVTFTCTGSESNDLALRLAQNFTGGQGIVVTSAAYHGNTALVTQVSPTLVRSGEIAPFVRHVPAPQSARGGGAAGGGAAGGGAAGGGAAGGSAAGGGAVGARFAADVAAAIADLERCGVGFAALLADSIFSSDGVFADPTGLLRGAVDVVHAAGGLFIADEVQCGFGRTGESLWGFARHGVAPDVVTMGKPMGNGYPMGAVVTRPEILTAFCAKFGYFNTFGGSPVGAAAAQAVLEVIEREDLMGNAARVGASLKRGLEALAARHASIGEVRGAGLYIGVELVGEGRTAAPEQAKAVINALRERGVLIGAAGRTGSVLKIRPPLCFAQADADRLLETLDAVLAGHGGAARI